MSNAQNISSPQGTKPRLDTTYARSGIDIPLEYLEPVYIPPSNDVPFASEAHSPPDRAPEALDERLYDDLCKGAYECPICTDTIEIESQMWSCKDCYHIYHFPCAKEWAEKRKDGSEYKTWRWPCPTCKRLQIGGDDVMTPACWCGRWRHHSAEVIGNSCGKKCPGYRTCESPGPKCERFCQKLCHPGPCEEVECVSTCMLVRFPHFKTGKKPVKNVYRIPQPSPRASHREPVRVVEARTRAEREAAEAAAYDARENRLPRQTSSDSDREELEPSFGSVIFTLILLGALETGLGFWVSYHNERWTHPLKHRDFNEHRRTAEVVFAVLIGMILCGVVNLILAGAASYEVSRVLTKNFNLRPHGGRRFLMFVFLGLFSLGCVMSFPIAYMSSADVAWNKQMKRTCEGFDTRIKLDSDKGIAASSFFLYEPNFIDEFYEPRPRIPGLDTFNLTNPRKANLSKLSPEPFRSYHRLSGAFSYDQPMFIDFDLGHFTWRIMASANATNGKTETLVRNGTWTNTSSSHPHVTFPELNLQAPNFHHFSRKCYYQPFMTFFRTDGMITSQIIEQSERDWSPKSENNVVMRTASFGHGQQNLEVCARRKDYDVLGKDNQWETKRGLHDDVIVPLGLIAVSRRQMRMEKRLPSDCWK